MVPAANMLGFAGQELSRKMPQKAIAVVLETTFGSVVELILFMVLLKTDNNTGRNVPILQAAILGSILANILLCLGSCFVAGGIKNDVQELHEAVSESGSGLVLIAASMLQSILLVRRKVNKRSCPCPSSRLFYISDQEHSLY